MTLDNGPSLDLVQIHHGRLITSSIVISKEFGRRHDNVLQSLASLIEVGTINRLDFKEIKYFDAKKRLQRAIELTERGALITMPFIGGKRSQQGQIRLVDAFLTMRARLTLQPESWIDLRRRASIGYRMMSDALEEVRAEQGKITTPHHFANEARLLNWVLFGKFDTVDREQLTPSDLALLEALETKNALWIARGRQYHERKAALLAYLKSLRARSLEVTR